MATMKCAISTCSAELEYSSESDLPTVTVLNQGGWQCFVLQTVHSVQTSSCPDFSPSCWLSPHLSPLFSILAEDVGDHFPLELMSLQAAGECYKYGQAHPP